MTHPTDEELDALVRKLEAQAYQQGRIARHAMIDAKSAITALRAQLAEAKADKERLGRELNLARYGQPDFSWQVHKEAMAAANARADRAEAALAAQIEADARIVEALYRNALGESDADLESPWKSHKASAFGIAVGAIRAQPHDRAALEAAPHVNKTPKSEHDSADVLTAVTLAEALQVPEVQAMAEALRELLIAADGESYAQYFSALEAAAVALRAIEEGEA